MTERFISPEEFLTAILALLTKRAEGAPYFIEDDELDRLFHRAWEVLALETPTDQLKCTFTFEVNPLHGNSRRLRSALLWALNRGFVKAEQGRHGRRLNVQIPLTQAAEYLTYSPIPKEVLERVVNVFPKPTFPVSA